MKWMNFCIAISLSNAPVALALTPCASGQLSTNLSDPSAQGQVVLIERDGYQCLDNGEVRTVDFQEVLERIQEVVGNHGLDPKLETNILGVYLYIDPVKHWDVFEQIAKVPGVRAILPNSPIER